LPRSPGIRHTPRATTQGLVLASECVVRFVHVVEIALEITRFRTFTSDFLFHLV
jgi:hypothetical protein